MSMFEYTVSTVIGVVIGVLITMFVDYIKSIVVNINLRKNFKNELKINIKKIDSWLDGINSCRNCVNSETMDNFFYYFDFGRFVVNSANQLFSNGNLYKILNEEEFIEFQIICQEFSSGYESIINKEFSDSKVNFDKKHTISIVDFWEQKFKKHKSTLNKIMLKL